MNKFFELFGKMIIIVLAMIIGLGLYAKYFDNKAYVQEQCEIGSPSCEKLKQQYNID